MALCGCIIAILELLTAPEIPLGARLAYWIGGLIAAWILVQLLAFVGTAVAKLLGLAPQWGYAFAIPLATVAISWGILYWSGGIDLALSEGFARVWVSASIVGLGFFGLFYFLYTRVETAPEVEQGIAVEAEETPSQIDLQTKLHDRLPPGFPPILALSVEDHYTRVHAVRRSEMVLMPLKEAITLMPEGQGKQVHRSWWAARDAVVSHKREGRDIRLILDGNLEVPVSRTQVKNLREAGWLA